MASGKVLPDGIRKKPKGRSKMKGGGITRK